MTFLLTPLWVIKQMEFNHIGEVMAKSVKRRKASKRAISRQSRVANKPRYNHAESAVAWLYARGYLTQRQYEAAEALRRDYEFAQMNGMRTMSWSPVRVDTSASADPAMSLSESRLVAKERFQVAMDRAGRDLQDICWRVICAGDTVPQAEKDMGWPTRSGKLVLRMALDRIADFYRVPG